MYHLFGEEVMRSAGREQHHALWVGKRYRVYSDTWIFTGIIGVPTWRKVVSVSGGVFRAAPGYPGGGWGCRAAQGV